MKKLLAILILLGSILNQTFAGSVDPASIFIGELTQLDKTAEEKRKDFAMKGAFAGMLLNYLTDMERNPELGLMSAFITYSFINELTVVRAKGEVVVSEEGVERRYRVQTYDDKKVDDAVNMLLAHTGIYLEHLSLEGLKVITHFDKLTHLDEEKLRDFRNQIVKDYNDKRPQILQHIRTIVNQAKQSKLDTKGVCEGSRKASVIQAGRTKHEVLGRDFFDENVQVYIDNELTLAQLNSMDKQELQEYDFTAVVKKALDNANDGLWPSELANKYARYSSEAIVAANSKKFVVQMQCEEFEKYNEDLKRKSKVVLFKTLGENFGKDVEYNASVAMNSNKYMLDENAIFSTPEKVLAGINLVSVARLNNMSAIKYFKNMTPEDLIEVTGEKVDLTAKTASDRSLIYSSEKDGIEYDVYQIPNGIEVKAEF